MESNLHRHFTSGGVPCPATNYWAESRLILEFASVSHASRGGEFGFSLVLDFLASGMSVEEVMKQYDLDREDVLACIAYGAEMSRERYVDIPVETGP